MRPSASLQLVLALGVASCASSCATASRTTSTPASARPLVDHHQHIFSPVRRLRELRFERIVYGSDAAVHVASEYASFRTLPLSDAEFRMIEANVAPYMR